MALLGMPSRRNRVSLDLAALALAPVGAAAIVVSQFATGVPFGALFQLEAALVVFGGTLGALLISYSPRTLWLAARGALVTFVRERHDDHALASTMVGLASKAHRRGLIAVDSELDEVGDPFLREGMRHAVDEPSGEALRSILLAECAARHAEEEAPARVFEAAAGYAPTLGILGAVLGLIDVMRHLRTPHALGDGIAVAFVATVYGVGLANLGLLPLAGRLRERAADAARRRDMITHGICAIHKRIHPRALSHTLRAFGVTVTDESPARLIRPQDDQRLPA